MEKFKKNEKTSLVKSYKLKFECEENLSPNTQEKIKVALKRAGNEIDHILD